MFGLIFLTLGLVFFGGCCSVSGAARLACASVRLMMMRMMLLMLLILMLLMIKLLVLMTLWMTLLMVISSIKSAIRMIVNRWQDVA